MGPAVVKFPKMCYSEKKMHLLKGKIMIEKKWNLDKLYTSFEAPELQADLQKADQMVAEILCFVQEAFINYEDAASKLLKYYETTDELASLLDIIGNYANLVYAVDTKNTVALKLMEKVENYDPQITLIKVGLRKWLKGLDNLENFLLENPALNTYAFDIQTEKTLSQHLLSDGEEVLLAEMKNTGSNAWGKLQDASIASLMVDYEDQKLPITIIRNYAYAPEAEKRKKAYDAELNAYGKIENVSAACLNAIKGEVITVAGKRGFSSPLEMTLLSSRMDKETLDAMMQAIEAYLPVFRRYLKKKATLLGHENGLPFYDLFAPVGTADMTYTYEEAIEFIITHFSSFSEKLGAYAKKAFTEGWIDSEPREGKVAGAFCSNIHGLKESRIMANFSGSYSDVSTLAHELGHGYHGDCLKDVLFTNSDYSMPIAETASIFCETLVAKAALKTATKEQAMAILENDLMGSTQVIVDIYSRYLFETELFEARKEASLSVDELKTMMLEAQKKAYGDGLDPNFLHPNMWTCKPHYYSADANFYNFPYAFGLMFSKGLYATYLNQGEAFIPKYDALLTATGCHNIKDTLAIMGVDAHSPEFFKSSLALIEEEINEFLSF